MLRFIQDKGQQSASAKCHSPLVNGDSLHRQESAIKQISSQIVNVSHVLLKTIYAFPVAQMGTQKSQQGIFMIHNQCARTNSHVLATSSLNRISLQGTTLQGVLMHNFKHTLVPVYWGVMFITAWTGKQHHAVVTVTHVRMPTVRSVLPLPCYVIQSSTNFSGYLQLLHNPFELPNT